MMRAHKHRRNVEEEHIHTRYSLEWSVRKKLPETNFKVTTASRIEFLKLHFMQFFAQKIYVNRLPPKWLSFPHKLSDFNKTVACWGGLRSQLSISVDMATCLYSKNIFSAPWPPWNLPLLFFRISTLLLIDIECYIQERNYIQTHV